MREKDFDIKNPKKKFQKTERVPPEGYECANDFLMPLRKRHSVDILPLKGSVNLNN